MKLERTNEELNTALQKEIRDTIEGKSIEGKARKIVIDNVKIKGGDHSYNTLSAIISAKKSSHAKATGDITLIDNNTGEVLERSKNQFLGNVPTVTKKGGFVINGSAYVVPHQMRLRSGAYTSTKQNGDTETMLNPSSGSPMKLITPSNKNETGFHLGGRKFNSIDVLTILGKSKKEIIGKIGTNAYESLSKKSNIDKTTRSLAEKMRIAIPADAASMEQVREQLKDSFNKMKLEEGVVHKTLGIREGNITGNVMLSALHRNIDVTKNGGGDDKENLAFKKIMTPEKLITEGMSKKIGAELFKIKGKMNGPIRQPIKETLSGPIIGSKPADFITTSSLSRMPEEYNSLQMKQIQSDITPLGEGGITGTEMITPSVRSLHSSQLGFIDPIKSPEGANTGVTLSLSKGAHIDEHGTAHLKVKNLKTGKQEVKSVDYLWDKKLAFPDPDDKGNVGIRHGSSISKGKLSSAQYQIPHAEDIYGPGMNALGIISSNDPTRNLMASKHVLQALPLTHREVSGVDLMGSEGSMHSHFGKEFLPTSPSDGKITKIDKKKGFIHIEDGKGNIHKESFASVPMQMNSKTFIHHAPSVKVGQKIKKGQTLADSNQTRNGELALGTNVRTAWMMYPGTRNDTVVISEDAAKKFTSEHSTKFDIDDNKDGFMDKERFMSLFPEIALKHNMENYDSRGIIKPGITLAKGDPVAFRARELDKHEAKFENTKIKKMMFGGYVPEISEWQYKNTGKLSGVKKNGNQIRVTASYNSPAEVGDKLVGRSGNKGIIGKIVPMSEIPRDEDGRAIDVILGGASVISRQNPAQIIEAALGSVAKKTGERYTLDHYSHSDMAGFARDEAKKHGVKLYHNIQDPTRKEKLDKPVFVGDYNMMKLFKQGESSWSATGRGPVDGLKQPKKGGKESASAISNMEINSLLAHNAKDFLREAYHIRSQENKDWFDAFEGGKPLPKPEGKAAVGRFNAYMSQMNVNVNDTDKGRMLLPMTDKDVLAQSNGVVKNGTGLKRNTMDPQKGGIYDLSIFGNHGTHQGHIDTKEKFLNPLYQTEIGKIIGKSSSEVNTLISQGKSADMYSELKNLDINKAIRNQNQMLKGMRDPNNANRVVRTIKTLKKFQAEEIKPHEAMFLSKIPVLATQHRPIAKLPDGKMLTHDVNLHYKNIIDGSDMLTMAKKDGTPPNIVNGLRGELQQHIGALYGVNDSPDPKMKQKNIKGMLDVIGGDNPKTSFWHKNILKNKVFTSGRAVITPHNKSLSMDEAEIPNEIAWKIFEPHMLRKMTSSGIDLSNAKERIKNRDITSTYALDETMKKIPIVVNRAPSLHKHNYTGHYAKRTSGATMNLPPEVEPMHNADYDGDQLAIHVPLTQKSIEDVKTKLLPSKQLFSAANRDALIASIDLDPFIGFYEGSKK